VRGHAILRDEQNGEGEKAPILSDCAGSEARQTSSEVDLAFV